DAALTVAARIDVCNASTTVEIAQASDFTGDGERLRHPYTRALWQALPQNDFLPIAGSQPPPGTFDRGCPFASRCELAIPRCEEQAPEKRWLRDGWVWCDHVS